MFLAAFLALGLPRERLEENLARIGLGRFFTLEYGQATRHGLAGRRIEFPRCPEADQHPAPKDLAAADDILTASGLPATVRGICEQLFLMLAEAEARVHGTTVDKIHFHEVGDYDTLADFVGFATALDWLQPDAVALRPVPLGSGFIECAHGRLPLPGPAATVLLENLPVVETGIAAELATPTGAALYRYLHESFPHIAEPVYRLEAVGYGAGRRELEERPNLLRLRCGRLAAASATANFAREEIVVLETLIDDLSPEKLADLAATLRHAGAIEVGLKPVLMKKGRPGNELFLLTALEREAELVELLFRLSPTLGIRRRLTERYLLERRSRTFTTSFGEIRGKAAYDRGGRRMNFKLEADDLAARAREAGCSPSRIELLAGAEIIRQELK